MPIKGKFILHGLIKCKLCSRLFKQEVYVLAAFRLQPECCRKMDLANICTGPVPLRKTDTERL